MTRIEKFWCGWFFVTMATFGYSIGFVVSNEFLRHHASAITEASGYPPIPATVVSQVGPTRILRVPGLKCGDDRAIGCYTVSDHTIRIEANIDRNVAWETLEHEMFHMILADAGGGPFTEDQMADLVGAYRVMAMRAKLNLP